MRLRLPDDNFVPSRDDIGHPDWSYEFYRKLKLSGADELADEFKEMWAELKEEIKLITPVKKDWNKDQSYHQKRIADSLERLPMTLPMTNGVESEISYLTEERVREIINKSIYANNVILIGMLAKNESHLKACIKMIKNEK